MECGGRRLLEHPTQFWIVDRRVRALQAFEVGLLTATGVARSSAATGRAAEAIETFQQAADAGRTLAFEQRRAVRSG